MPEGSKPRRSNNGGKDLRKERLAFSARQRRELWKMELEMIQGCMTAWRELKFATLRVKYGLQIAYMIKQLFDGHKDVESRKFLSPQEYGQRMCDLEELDRYIEAHHQRQIKKKIQEIDSSN